jgi:hypothetical protein
MKGDVNCLTCGRAAERLDITFRTTRVIFALLIKKGIIADGDDLDTKEIDRLISNWVSQNKEEEINA